MDNLSTKKILSSPVVLLRPSTEEEQKLLFPNNHGCFYTLGLKSGQSFVAQLPRGQGEEEDPFDLDNFSFRLRPLNNLVPQLKEVKWVFTGAFGGPGTHTFCEMATNTSEQEKSFFEDILGAHPVRDPYSTRRTYQSHEMFTKLNEVHNQLLENHRMKLALMTGQQRLRDLMILNDSNPIDQVVQQKIIQERRKQNG